MMRTQILTFYDVIALSIWKLVSPFGVQMLLRVMQPSGHEMRSNLVSNNLMALTRRSNHDLVSGCWNCFLQTIPCPGADDATFAPEKSIYSCSDFYESNHLLSLSLPRFYDWYYFLGVHVSELIWTDWCIGQEEARLKSLFCSWRFYFHLIFNFKMCSIFEAEGQDDPVPEQIHHGDRQRTSICWMNLWVWMWNKTWHLCS